MAHFRYKGRSSQGLEQQGVIEGINELAVTEQLIRRGIMPTQIQPSHAAGTTDWSLLFERQVRLEDLVMFSRQMYALTRAGIPILRAMAGLAESTPSQLLKTALAQIGDDLGNGKPLSSAMQAHPKVFNTLFIAIIHVGENTGQLEDAFKQLAEYLELELETRKRIKTAMRYPIFVVMALVMAMVVLNIFVIPTFASLFAKFGAELPWTTRFLLATSHLFVNYWHWMLGGTLGVIVLWRRWVSTPEGRYTWHSWQLRLMIVGPIITRTLLGRFARSFAMMLRAGVPLNTAITLVADAVDNAWMGKRIHDMRSAIESGDSLLRTSMHSQLFPPLVLQMIAVGEETGQIEHLMQEVAEYYEREVDYDLKSLTARIEPVLICIVAGMVLILALGIFTPMWDLMSVVKGK